MLSLISRSFLQHLLIMMSLPIVGLNRLQNSFQSISPLLLMSQQLIIWSISAVERPRLSFRMHYLNQIVGRHPVLPISMAINTFLRLLLTARIWRRTLLITFMSHFGNFNLCQLFLKVLQLGRVADLDVMEFLALAGFFSLNFL